MATALGMTTAELIGASLMATSTGISAYSAAKTIEGQEKAMDKQEEAQERAEAKQAEADRKAETARLEALAKNQEQQSGFDFGVDSALAKRYSDAAQKWGAGTGEMSQKEEEENPFYSRGLF